MRNSALFLAAATLLFTSACSSKSDSGTVTISPDSVVTAMDTAKALTDSVAPVKTASGPQLDSLASAETTLAFMKNSGHWDAYQSGIIPTIMEQNLDYARRLLRSPHAHFIIVDKQSMNVILYDKYGREEKCYLMACSKYYGTKHKRRDNRTPEGFFSAEGIYNSTDWLYTNDDGYTSPARGQFGPRFIRLKTPVTTQVGIHGPAARHSPGHRASHGCIRIQNEQILELVKYAKVGMPIIVNPSDRDRKVNESEGYSIPQLNIGKGTYTPGTRGKDNSESAKPAKKAATDSAKTSAPADKAIEAESGKANNSEKTAEPEKTKEPEKAKEPTKTEPAKTEPAQE